MKKAVLIISKKNFRDEELAIPKETLQKNGIEVEVASTTLEPINGMLGGSVYADMLFEDVKADDFDAVVFIGGSGAEQYWDDPSAHKLARDTVAAKKILAAICIAPVILAKAGVLKGKRATVSSFESEFLTQAGAKYTGRSVEKDANIITAEGPAAAGEFANELVKALNK